MNEYATIKLFCDGHQSYEYSLIGLIEFQHVRIQRIQPTLSFLSVFPIVLIYGEFRNAGLRTSIGGGPLGAAEAQFWDPAPAVRS